MLNIFMVFFITCTKLYIAEAFPTKLRAQAISVTYSIGRLGDICSFLLCDFTHSLFDYGPMLVIIGACILGIICTFLLRIETYNKALDS